MNLVLSFVHPKKPSRTVGPFQSIRLDGDGVREDPKGAIVARHRDHQWEVEGERYYRLDATTSVRVHFERRPDLYSRVFGPYRRFSAVDGIAYTDDRVFAFVDTKLGDWFCYDDGHHWPVMVVSDATDRKDADLLGSLASLAPLLPGVIALWQGTRLLYLEAAACLRSRIALLLGDGPTFDGEAIGTMTWEPHPDPAKRHAEIAAEYEEGSRSLAQAFGHVHGNRVRTDRLIARARHSVARARRLREVARALRSGLRAVPA